MESLSATTRRAFFRLAEAGATLSAMYHRAQLLGAEHLPSHGAVLLVGNHGVWGYETPAFFHLLHQASGRYPLGLADRGFFRIPLLRTVLPWLGGVEGTPANALTALREGQLVVCYPGGAREVFKRSHGRYMLRWEQALGFVRLAARARVPIVPFAGFGVDDTFFYPPGEERLSLRLSARDKYRVPLVMGLGPLPLPVRMTFAMGEPHAPPPENASEPRLKAFRDRIAASVRGLLLRACHA
ncbi:lysophospholipid acyltransferase family protein [Stigmatella sp. ncwal1]|uniref:Lysophospholipid acyltransferase family protein n=1 Tax=Stigmatella ashevillensis TaxID=2995309 RepID=A0ABT5DEY1_9BACT|nr:lysophospholipid acyltransferase family protein [Stigmatella ashevillena]MDC0712163.1 lysophospholipid acyltransferase family protein [Stigmatella ashevillena]